MRPWKECIYRATPNSPPLQLAKKGIMGRRLPLLSQRRSEKNPGDITTSSRQMNTEMAKGIILRAQGECGNTGLDDVGRRREVVTGLYARIRKRLKRHRR